MIKDLIVCIGTGFLIGIDAFVKVLPLYDFLSGIKVQMLSLLTGITVIFFSIIFLLPGFIKIFKKVIRLIVE